MIVPNLVGLQTHKGLIVEVRGNRSKAFPMEFDVYHKDCGVVTYRGSNARKILDLSTNTKNSSILIDALVDVLLKKNILPGMNQPVIRVVERRVFLMEVALGALYPRLVWDLEYGDRFNPAVFRILMRECRDENGTTSVRDYRTAATMEDYDAANKRRAEGKTFLVWAHYPGAQGDTPFPVKPEDRGHMEMRLRSAGFTVG